MPYTKVFNKPYADGYKDRPDLSTPETAANLNAKDNALEHIEEYLLNQKTSDLQNDSGFVNNNDVSEAIKGKADKSTTYTKTEVDELVPDNKELLEDLSDSEGKLAYKGEVIGGGGNANERELTYAEYQALSEEERMNGTNYFVTDYPSGSGGGASHVDFENYAELGTLKFGVDGDGNYGYYKADDSFVPFKSGGSSMYDVIESFITRYENSGSVNISIGEKIYSKWNGGARLGAYAYSNDKVDLTNYNTISVKFIATAHYSNAFFVHLLVSNSITTADPRTTSNYVKETRSTVLNEEVTLTLDVSDLTGEYYIGLAPIGTTCEMYDLKFD